MISVFNSLNTAIDFTQKGKASKIKLLTVTSFREAEYRRYVQAAQFVYPMWVYILNERPERYLRVFARITVHKVSLMIYRLQEIRTTNFSMPLFRKSEVDLMLDTLTEMYNNLIELAAPDSVQQVYDVLLNNPSGHGTV
ncbi:hypothetical protein SAMN05660461_5971 [Chitinophaga ginsengisegetis]|uniref:Uncharacterized protein n=1 Tax=Chitinophaga ginsengisegetis TaxID=393003 RepID=A0A1T5PBG9_9BACT|nr:hypothetical protein [Chitinophaga ginsengisegetis]SKD10071.1 hypothetical protein SAMN05660461_5971 [Chitinophaga ginsengisegetis]